MSVRRQRTLSPLVLAIATALTAMLVAALPAPAASATTTIPTSTRLVISAPTDAYGDPYQATQQLTASVWPLTWSTGKVLFYDADRTLLGVAPVIGGTATVTVWNLSVGAHRITASFQPDLGTPVAASTSNTVARTVYPKLRALFWGGYPAVNLSVFSTPYTGRGSVAFYDGNVLLCLMSVLASSNGEGVSTCVVSAQGTHTYRVQYQDGEVVSPFLALPVGG